MPAPWNSFSACLLAKNDRIGRARLDLVNEAHVNPLRLEVHRESGGFVPWNACPACPACPVGQNDRAGVCPVGSANPTGVESFLFLSGSLPSSGFRPRNSEMLHAPCAMLATPLGLHALRYAPCPLSSVICSLPHEAGP